MLFNNNEHYIENSNQFLHYAWSLKFLDIVILHIHNNKYFILQEYNPFTNTYNETNLYSKKDIFSDKLKDMNGYFVKTLAFNKPPYMYMDNRLKGSTYGGITYNFIETLSKYLNYTVNFVSTNNTTTVAYIFAKLNNNEINIMPLPGLKGTNYHQKDFYIGQAFWNDNMRLIVPILYTYETSQLLNIFIYILAPIIVIFCIFITMKVLTFKSTSSNIWTVFYIYQVLFGITVTENPKNSIHKIIFFGITVISIKYSSDITTLLTNDQIIFEREVNFDALQEIENPSLPIYVNKNLIKTTENEKEGKIFEYIHRNAKDINIVAECLAMLAKEKDRMCITPQIYSEYFIAANLGFNKKPAMKAAEPMLYRDISGFAYEKASPFAKKFDVKFQQIVESGIPDTWGYGKKYSDISHKDEVTFQSNIYNIQFIFVLTVGYSSSFVVFLFELFHHKKKVECYSN